MISRAVCMTGMRVAVVVGVLASASLAGAVEIRHYVPEDKGLSDAWIRSLYERGAKETYSGDDLDAIGMPVGGIGAGQLYLCGDGTLGNWEIFNSFVFNGVGAQSYSRRIPSKPVEQGFAIVLKDGNGWQAKRLNKADFPQAKFRGEYPIGNVYYEADGFSVAASMEAFSPFIPLNAPDSGLPATLFHITVENRSDKRVEASLLGWLENAVGVNSLKAHLEGTRMSRIEKSGSDTFLLHAAKPLPEKPKDPNERAPITLADFEGASFGDWRAEGIAFGDRPRTAAPSSLIKIEGFLGAGYVDSQAGGLEATGALVSPAFTVNRRFLNVLRGGRELPDKIAIVLIIDGREVVRESGGNTFALVWRTWDLLAYEGKQAQIRLVDEAVSVPAFLAVDHIEISDVSREAAALKLETQGDFGTMALAMPGKTASDRALKKAQAAQPDFLDDYAFAPPASWPLAERHNTALLSAPVRLSPGEKHTFTAVLAWHFPNAKEGHAYAARFDNAQAVAAYVLDNEPRLSADTRLWRDTYYDSTLPYWLLDRLHSTVSYLATGTAQWWANDRFWAFEGVVCCAGTCTHVWNYAHGQARLFPELARSAREMQDFCSRECGGGFDCNTGLVGFRGDANYAADGQCGTVLKAYREHTTSPDDKFLATNWPNIKKALEFSITQDGNEDGLIENTQHNTFDINFEGPNTFVGSLYLGALKAGAAMAREMGEDALAERYLRIWQSGARLTCERLWDGEYFIQDVDLKQFPKHQYGKGCMSDHVFGQGWAHQLGLGYIYPEANVKKALEAVWRYNWAPDVGPQQEKNNPGRPYARPGQGGLFTCTWPKSEYLPEGVLYRNEIWTGIEYQVAGHMIWEGMTDEGLSICRAVHDRYQPHLINPYNEVECGDHYARALASWGVFTALAGYGYDGPEGRLSFAPKVSPENFRTAFTTAEGWGTFEQTRSDATQQNTVALRWGTLRLKRVTFDLAPGAAVADVEVKVNGASQPVVVNGLHDAGPQGRVTILMEKELVLGAGDTLVATSSTKECCPAGACPKP